MIFSLWTENKLLLTPSLPFLMLFNILRTVFCLSSGEADFPWLLRKNREFSKLLSFSAVLKGKIDRSYDRLRFLLDSCIHYLPFAKLAFRLRHFAQRQKLARISYESLAIIILPVDFPHIFIHKRFRQFSCTLTLIMREETFSVTLIGTRKCFLRA